MWSIFTIIVVCLVVLLFFRPLRAPLISLPIMKLLAGFLPKMSETERIALEAGTVWWDADLFSGKPDWKKLFQFKIPPLSQEEKNFLAGPVEELCKNLDEWKIAQARDLPPHIWEFLKKEKFFGMIIPKEYGGLGFSAQAHSAVITKVASRSLTTVVVNMVPNSLGPAELLLHYGTKAQKDHYLPRLAVGTEIPCFALTEPEAGSDAASIKSRGVICRGIFEGREVLGMKLQWEKRYITLAPVSTLLGLAFRLYDPEHLIGDKEDLGITCALIPTNLPGVQTGEHHDPMGIPFPNGPTRGKDVFVPLDYIIGGAPMAGRGWEMLMQCLAAGRSISLPSLCMGKVQMVARTTSAYANIREQFNVTLGQFEGIEEALARIGGVAYFMNAARTLTAGAVDAGEKPSVVSAIVKAYLTEAMRNVINDGMDIRAGSAICQGPRNTLGHSYTAVPISITVEGANILTRTLIIFGQGAIRCHPYVQKEMRAIAQNNLSDFDKAFFGHIGFVIKNSLRSFLMGLTGACFASSGGHRELAPYIRQMTRLSSAFAFTTDVAMGILGGDLKRKEKLSGRLADILAWLYIASAVSKRFVDTGKPKRDWVYAKWSLEYSLFKVQEAFFGFIENFPVRPIAWFLKFWLFPFGHSFKHPSDKLGAAVADSLLNDSEARKALTSDIYIPPKTELGLGQMEEALEKTRAARSVEDKIKRAVKAKTLKKAPREELLKQAAAQNIISKSEEGLVAEAIKARSEAIQVDSFDRKTYLELRV